MLDFRRTWTQTRKIDRLPGTAAFARTHSMQEAFVQSEQLPIRPAQLIRLGQHGPVPKATGEN